MGYSCSPALTPGRGRTRPWQHPPPTRSCRVCHSLCPAAPKAVQFPHGGSPLEKDYLSVSPLHSPQLFSGSSLSGFNQEDADLLGEISMFSPSHRSHNMKKLKRCLCLTPLRCPSRAEGNPGNPGEQKNLILGSTGKAEILFLENRVWGSLRTS